MSTSGHQAIVRALVPARHSGGRVMGRMALLREFTFFLRETAATIEYLGEQWPLYLGNSDMSDSNQAGMGSVTWRDLTVGDADALSQFYQKVVGWSASAFEMAGYSDYVMKDESGETVAGICHARGSNQNLPPQWLIYITVPDVAASAKACVEFGGAIVDGPRKMCGRSFCVIRDPAGAMAAIIEPE